MLHLRFISSPERSFLGHSGRFWGEFSGSSYGVKGGPRRRPMAWFTKVRSVVGKVLGYLSLCSFVTLTYLSEVR